MKNKTRSRYIYHIITILLLTFITHTVFAQKTETQKKECAGQEHTHNAKASIVGTSSLVVWQTPASSCTDLLLPHYHYHCRRRRHHWDHHHPGHRHRLREIYNHTHAHTHTHSLNCHFPRCFESTLLVGRQEGYPAYKKLGVDNLTIALHVLQLELSPPLPLSLAPVKPANPGSPRKMVIRTEKDFPRQTWVSQWPTWFFFFIYC